VKSLVRLVLAGLLLTVTAAGCDGQAAGGPATATGCAAYAVDAIRAHEPVGSATQASRLPAPCRGLGPAALSQAVRIAAGQFAQHAGKARRRHLTGLARAHLGYLIGAAQREATARAAARPGGPSRPGTGSSARPSPPGWHVPVGVAALVAWLLTAGSGAVLVARRLARRRGSGPGARLPAVLIVHLGLAVGGLAAWTGYLLTGWAPLAWTALGILAPVAGLGMATLLATIPDPISGPGPVASSRAPVLVIAGHGVLATLTMLLALLGAVAAVVPR
jgi:manganese efflux pump family protein